MNVHEHFVNVHERMANACAAGEPVKNAGINIQVRRKNPVSSKLLSRKITEYWLNAAD